MDPGRGDPAARPATDPRPGRSRGVVGVALAALALVASRLGPAGFCAFVSVVSGLAALELATTLKHQGTSAKPIAAGAGAAAFAAGAYQWGEMAILAVAAALFVIYAGGLAIRGLRPGVVRTLAALLLPAIYAGLAGAFLVLVRQGAQGRAMVDVFIGMVVAHRLGLWAGSRRASPHPHPVSRTGIGAGALACVVVSPLLRLLLDHRPGVGPMLGIGVFVALAATVGALAGALFSTSSIVSSRGDAGAKGPPRPVLAQIEPALLAAPAFFYAFRLLLT